MRTPRDSSRLARDSSRLARVELVISVNWRVDSKLTRCRQINAHMKTLYRVNYGLWKAALSVASYKVHNL